MQKELSQLYGGVGVDQPTSSIPTPPNQPPPLLYPPFPPYSYPSYLSPWHYPQHCYSYPSGPWTGSPLPFVFPGGGEHGQYPPYASWPPPPPTELPSTTRTVYPAPAAGVADDDDDDEEDDAAAALENDDDVSSQKTYSIPRANGRADRLVVAGDDDDDDDDLRDATGGMMGNLSLSDQSSVPGGDGDEATDLQLFEALRDTIYSEVAALISQNEMRPHFLV